MRSLTRFVVLTVVILFSGCATQGESALFSESFWNPFGLKLPFAPDEKPVRVGVVTDGRCVWNVRALWDISDQTPWTNLRSEMSRHTKKPVQVEELKPFQIALQLESGYLDFALLSDAQLVEMQQQCKGCRVIAYADRPESGGLIVASSHSDITSIKDIAGKRFAFGPRGNPVLHYGAAAALDAEGVSLDKIQREIVPLDTLQYHISSREVAKEVAYGTTSVGVIDRDEYEQYPQTGGRFFPLSFSKDQFRVLGETPPVNFGPVVASANATPQLVQTVREFLVDAAMKAPRVTQSLGVAGFTGAEDVVGSSASSVPPTPGKP